MESFSSACERFLKAVQNKNAAEFHTFLDDRSSFLAVLPGGQVFSRVEDYRSSQQDWFRSPAGSFEPTIEKIVASEDLGVAMVRVQYGNTTDTGISFRAELMLSLVFRHLETRWLLEMSQNTVLGEVEV